MENEIHTIFVDNLPNSMDPKGLYKVFTNFGIVKDVFIPNKRRKMTRSRFGFIRYACPVAANMAVQKAHGIWCDNRALKVKEVDFVKGGKSYAQALSGRGLVTNTSITLMLCLVGRFGEGFGKGNGKGNGWLYESVIVRLKPIHCAEAFKEELKIRGMGDIQVRDGGGRDMVLTFESMGSLKEKLKLMEGWVHDWSESIKEWKQGMTIEQERLAWITCYGVPLNLWSSKTFNSIRRLWGEVISLDDDTARLNSFHNGKVRIATKCMESINRTINLRCKGTSYPVRVYEEQVVISEVIYKQCKCYSGQNTGVKQTSTGDEQEQRSEVGSKMVDDEADEEGQVSGDLDKGGAE
ncbi:hypothetical protein ACSBR2_025582 [Camellia fascicularis]